MTCDKPLIPAQAGIQKADTPRWVPAFAGTSGVLLLLVILLTLLILSVEAFAQSSPFGAGTPAPASSGGIIGWILAEQARFFRSLSAAIRAAKADGTAAWGLFWLSFLYGIFHAAGPGTARR